MPSARRSRYIQRKDVANKKRGFFVGLLVPIILLFLLFVGYLAVRLDTKYWNGRDKFSFAFRQNDGNVGVSILDPKSSEIVTLEIPGNTEVSVAKGYGTFQLKNVWQLGMNEKLNGSLLSATIAKNFTFPVFLWADEDGMSLETGSIASIFNFIFFPKHTNIPFGDRLSASIFAFNLKNLDKTVVDIGKSQFLDKGVLSDGSVGYKINGPISARLTLYFSDNDISDMSLIGQNLRVYIVDSTGTYSEASTVGSIIEVMGGKVVALDKSQGVIAAGCEILGSNKKIVTKIARVFNCKESSEKTNFDIELHLGSNFAKDF